MLLLAGCGGHVRPSITVSPRMSFSTQPVDIRVSGLKPHAATDVQLRSRDYYGALWIVRRTYRTDGRGRVQLGAALVGAMQPSPVRENVAYIWGNKQTFDLRVQQGATRLATTFTRGIGAGRPVAATLAHDGFIGRYFPPRARSLKPALLVFGGSEGGLSTGFLAATLAGQGFPTLAVAYFGLAGLPPKLDDVRLEYFARAIRWLDRQKGVDPKHVFVLGISRGSEAAQLLALDFPRLVHGVVASVPSDYVNGCYPECAGSAWSLHGKPIPFTGVGFPEGNPAYADARIPDERLQAPIFLVCGGADLIWPSCPYARDALRHLAHDRYPHELVAEPAGGHAVGELIPYEPNYGYFSTPADERAREDVWPRLIAFLRANG